MSITMSRIRGLTYLLLICAIGLGVATWLSRQRSSSPPSNATSPMSVVVTTATYDYFMPKLEAIGSTKAYESVVISTNTTEYLRKIAFKDGQSVQKGQLLAELEMSEEKAHSNSLQANLIEAQSSFKRSEALHKKRYLSSSEYDADRAKLSYNKAQLDALNSKIADRTIKAPFSGVLGIKQVSVGALLEAGDPIVTLDMITPIKVDITLPARYLQKIHIGQTIKAKTAAYPNQWFTGRVTVIAPRIDADTRSVRFLAEIENKTRQLIPGMLMKIEIPETPIKMLSLPEQALMAEGTLRYVFVVRYGVAHRVPVTLIGRTHGQVQVSGDIKPGAKVVIEGGFKLHPKQRVDVTHVAL